MSTSTLFRLRSKSLEFGKLPLVMGILNVTPDSFSDGGSFVTTETAVAHALQLVADGADLIDVGGESSRPGAEQVSVDEELRRVVPVIEALSQQVAVTISVDTTKAEVARQAVAAGAEIVNDISGLRFDAEMPVACAESGVGVICMHMQGTPQTMQKVPRYGNVVEEICAFFEERLSALEAAGVPRSRVMLDPGVGFGKTPEHNLQILSNIARFRELGRPVLIGHSRKRFLAKLIGRPVDERSYGTLAISISLAEQGVDMLRVHDVRATRDALLAWRAIAERVGYRGTRNSERGTRN